VPTTQDDRVIVTLDEAECHRLLLAVRVGRLGFTRNALPAIEPVSYCVNDGHVVIPARPDSEFLPGCQSAVVAFEIDDCDEEDGTGWSVTVVGPARMVSDSAEVAVCDALPWPLLRRPRACRYLAVKIGLVRGRRTVPSAPAARRRPAS
jgi:nitroimidazol reductase NimA-like FMN-containing flavoprotein (pyridoxamine 5'-phosphate oxidase superfamily)